MAYGAIRLGRNRVHIVLSRGSARMSATLFSSPRDGNLSPGAKKEPDAWKSYCKERWGMARRSVDEMIQALPVLRRHGRHGAREMPSIKAAEAVATLPEPVQDTILDSVETSADAKTKAKAVRKEAKRIETQEGREPTVDEMIGALPILVRFTGGGAAHEAPSVSAAARVATLP